MQKLHDKKNKILNRDEIHAMKSHTGAQDKENNPLRPILPLFKILALCYSQIFLRYFDFP